MFDLKDLKNSALSLEERASGLLETTGIAKDMAVNAISLKQGDKFIITGLKPIEMTTPSATFQPMVFITNTGAQIGTKHFANVDLDIEDAPSLGRTALEVATYAAFCIEKEIEFQVKKLIEGDARPIPGEPAESTNTYKPKTYQLLVV